MILSVLLSTVALAFAQEHSSLDGALNLDDACESSGEDDAACALNALQLRGQATQALSGGFINFLQWNPHWQCSAKSSDCTENMVHRLNSALVSDEIDFANVVELEFSGYAPPPGFTTKTYVCGKLPKGDLVTLIWDSRKWKMPTSNASGTEGCMVENNRPFIIQQFEAVDGIQQVIVIAAHFPHTLTVNDDRDTIRAGLGSVIKATGVESVALIADTNEFSNITSSSIMSSIGAPEGPTLSTDLIPTCCMTHNGSKFESFGGFLTFDRVIANFGNGMVTVELFRDFPSWAHQGEFHTAIKAKLIVGTG